MVLQKEEKQRHSQTKGAKKSTPYISYTLISNGVVSKITESKKC